MEPEYKEVKSLTGWIIFGAILFIWLGGTKVIGQLFLGLAALASFCIIYTLLPLPLRKLIAHLHVFVDIALTFSAWKIFGAHTATALTAGIIVGVGVSLFLLRQRRILLGKDYSLNTLISRM